MIRKVWIVIPDYDDEGHGEPERVFDSEEKAKAFVEEQRKTFSAPREIIEMDVE